MIGKVAKFFGEARQELAKVNWPTRHELTGSTSLVIVVTFIMSAIIFGIDMVLAFIMGVLIR